MSLLYVCVCMCTCGEGGKALNSKMDAECWSRGFQVGLM